MLDEEGLDAVIARHHRLAEGVRRGVKARGLALCAGETRRESDTVSAIVVPEGHDAAQVIDIAYHRHDLALAPGCPEWPARCSASATRAISTS